MAFINIQGAFFEQGPQGQLQVINDPVTLRGLRSGQIQAQTQQGLGTTKVSPTVATPSLVPQQPQVQKQTTPVQQTTQPTGITIPGTNTTFEQLQTLFQSQETPEQKAFREQQQASLERLISLEEQLAQAGKPSAELDAVRSAINEQSLSLINLTPESVLTGTPGLQDVGITQPFLEARTAAMRDPISRTLSRLVLSESVMAGTQQRELAGLQQQIGSQQRSIELQQAIQNLQPKPFSFGQLPESVQGNVLNRFLFPEQFQSPAEKQEQETIFNLAQTYPDAGITPQDDLITAQQKVATSGSFIAKNTSIQAIADPINGGVTFYNSKGGFVGNTNQGFNTSGFSPNAPDIQTQPNFPDWFKAATGEVNGIQYIDSGKLNSAQQPVAQRLAEQSGIPYLTEKDANAVKEAQSTFFSAKSLLDGIKIQAQKVITATNTAGLVNQQGRFALARAPFGVGANLAPSENVYIKTVDSFLSLLTRAAGEKGVLTTIDVNRIKQALPTASDTVTTRNAKLAQLESVFNSQLNGAVSSYIGSKASIDTNQGQTTGGNSYQIIERP